MDITIRCPHCSRYAPEFIDYYAPDEPIRCHQCRETAPGAAWRAAGDVIEVVEQHPTAGVSFRMADGHLMYQGRRVAILDIRCDDRPGLARVDWIAPTRVPADLKDRIDELADRCEDFRPEVA